MGASEIIERMQGLIYDDGGANYIMLNEGLSTVGDVISLIIGIIATGIMICIPLIVALEVLFINVPLLQSKILNDTIEKETIRKIIGVLFRDAKTAVVRANACETGYSANIEYLKIKIKSIFFAFLIIVIALGPVNMIIQWLLYIISNIISVGS